MIIADQVSTDGGEKAASGFRDVTCINSDSGDFNENLRQNLLIDTARQKFGMENILLKCRDHLRRILKSGGDT